MHGTFWSLLPFLIVIPVSILTRQVLPGLMVGLLVGSYMMHPTLLGGIDTALTYILKELAIPDNLRLIVFLYGFGAFVGLVRVTGGVTGFAKWMESRVKTVHGAFGLTWLSSLVTFMAPDFRIITVAPVVRHVFNRLKVPPTKVALVIDITSTPFTALIPLGTVFVGYMVGLLSTAGPHHGISGSPFHMLLLSLPFNFFSILALAYGAFTTFFGKSRQSVTRGATKSNSNRQSRQGAVGLNAHGLPAAGMVEASRELHPAPHFGERQDDGHEDNDDIPDAMEFVAGRVKPNLYNLVFPLALLLILTLFLTWWNGHTGASSFWQAFVKANAAQAMLQALLITLIASVIWYTCMRLSMSRTMFGFLAGGNEMMGVITLLTLIWGVSAISADLGFTTYTSRTIGHLVPSAWIAPVLFIFGCLLSYVIGSSFGAWGILMPIGLSLAASTHASLPLIVGAVFASGTFGGFASPLSDNTVAMATVMKLPVMQYSRAKLKPALLAAGGSALLYALAGFV